MLNIGLLGCGRIGQVHGATLRTLDTARAVAVADAVPEAADKLAATLAARAMTAEALIADPGIDAVVIGTPTTTHSDLIHAAAAAGKAIFCEKPIDLSVDRIRQVLAAVDEAGVPFMVAFNRRFDPGSPACGPGSTPATSARSRSSPSYRAIRRRADRPTSRPRAASSAT